MKMRQKMLDQLSDLMLDGKLTAVSRIYCSHLLFLLNAFLYFFLSLTQCPDTHTAFVPISPTLLNDVELTFTGRFTFLK